MTLLGAILKKVRSQESINYPSPPPEGEHNVLQPKKKKERVDKLAHVSAKVDTSPPRLDASRPLRALRAGAPRLVDIRRENIRLVMAIKKMHFMRGKVDSRWDKLPEGNKQYYATRVDFLKRVQADNQALYGIISTTGPKVTPTAEHERWWARTRRELLQRARGAFSLAPPPPRLDPVFAAPPGVHRPRATLTLGFRGGASLGSLRVELFADTCPRTCALFSELLRGDGLGHCYVGTRFYRKVPGLFWSGGDVALDCGFGCYAPRGRRAPPRAENFHYPHSAPGLLTMHVTRDDEVCGSFSITFKALPHLDLRSTVFGRVVFPSRTFESMRTIGSPFNTQPVVEIRAAEGF